MRRVQESEGVSVWVPAVPPNEPMREELRSPAPESHVYDSLEMNGISMSWVIREQTERRTTEPTELTLLLEDGLSLPLQFAKCQSRLVRNYRSDELHISSDIVA